MSENNELIKFVILVFYIFYTSFIPTSSIIVAIVFILQVNLAIFLKEFVNSDVNSIFLAIYILFLYKMDINFRNKLRKPIFMSYMLIYLLGLLGIMYLEKINFSFMGIFDSFIVLLFWIIIYLEFKYLKFKNIKQIFKNLNENFYISISLMLFLLILKLYLLLNNTKNPSLYYLFLTIPISVLAVYFYTKELEPIVKEYKSIQKETL